MCNKYTNMEIYKKFLTRVGAWSLCRISTQRPVSWSYWSKAVDVAKRQRSQAEIITLLKGIRANHPISFAELKSFSFLIPRDNIEEFLELIWARRYLSKCSLYLPVKMPVVEGCLAGWEGSRAVLHVDMGKQNLINNIFFFIARNSILFWNLICIPSYKFTNLLSWSFFQS